MKTYQLRLRIKAAGIIPALFFLCLLLAAVMQVKAADTTIISSGATWKYLDNGSDQGTAWRASAFNDSAWPSGAAQLGYGDGGEATLLAYGPDPNNKYITTYFRYSFNVADAAAFTSLTLRLLRDDGAVVYLNGAEVWRSNMPARAVGYRTIASTAVGGADESTFFQTSISPSLLVNGTNVLAVELHQSGGTSSDSARDARASIGETQPSHRGGAGLHGGHRAFITATTA